MKKYFAVFVLLFTFILPAYAVDYTNPNFILRNPVITVSGGRSTTPTFEFYSATGQTAPGQSTNSNFTYQAGFLYFGEAAAVSPTPGQPSFSGGGGPSGLKITFSGKAYPNTTVILLKDAQIVKTALADSDADFVIELQGLSQGDHLFSIYAKDYLGKSSRLLVFPVKGVLDKDTAINDILIPPTISKDKKQVKKGESVDIFGQSIPNAEITIEVETPSGILFFKTPSDIQGKYRYVLSIASLDYGTYKAISEVSFKNTTSKSSFVSFIVGDETIFEELVVCPLKADLNNDCAVNLVDFSILIYWFDRPNVPGKVDLNPDGVADLIDFSIMAYYWTG